MTDALLAVAGLRKSYGGVAAVKDASFSLGRGEVLALIGPNGAGKSTCFNMLNGQIRPDRGSITLDAVDVTGLKPRQMARRGVARTFQITAVFASMTARENVQTACVARAGLATRLAGRNDRRFVAEAEAWLEQVGLAMEAHRPAAELAYGDLKRLELAMVLTRRPALLLMDEPTAGMAPKERHALMNVVIAYARRERIGLLFTEHDMDIVFAHADRVLVLSRGELIASGVPEAVRRDPQVRACYLGDGTVYAARPEAGPA